MSVHSIQCGKNKKKEGTAPALALINPKYPHNVGAIVRAASCFGIQQVWFTGGRVSLDPQKGQRLPREERMKGYKEVELRQHDYFLDEFERDVTPIAIELRPTAELLPQFTHPDNALYIFGPEDGSISSVIRHHCHRFVVIPTRHCVNLAAAVYLILYDRLVKRQLEGKEPILSMDEILAEERGWASYAEDVPCVAQKVLRR